MANPLEVTATPAKMPRQSSASSSIGAVTKRNWKKQ